MRPALPLIVIFAGFFLSVSPCAAELRESAATSGEQVKRLREDYAKHREEFEAYRKREYQRYLESDTEGREAVISSARRELEKHLRTRIFPAWYGTDWDFNGVSTVPGEGKIACGYFVSTCLTHVGFDVSRIRLAQQPSQRIIETFMAKDRRTILAGGKPMADIRAYLKAQGDGIHIVGLDSHVGFVSVEGDEMIFVHSSYFEPDSFVKAEKIDSHNPLSESKYRVFGKIFADEMVVNWLSGHKYSVGQ